MTNEIPRLLTLNQLVAEQPSLRPGGLRALIFWEETNGLKASGAVIRVGRKILIDPQKFYNWISTSPSPKGNL